MRWPGFETVAAGVETSTVKPQALWLTPVPSRLIEVMSYNELESREIKKLALGSHVPVPWQKQKTKKQAVLDEECIVFLLYSDFSPSVAYRNLTQHLNLRSLKLIKSLVFSRVLFKLIVSQAR